ncbi:TetR/AcrR family transcriptional regulator C-terminal domain-containing protein [Streptomyces sp. NPDC051940]|uniref:TetR/AcrR family transcriptional regulator C-terminal domain-containing protein n=1 Tax=Streptomyces sp. NPDC051940 TaxID=3155675 RepID=UPI00343C7BC8
MALDRELVVRTALRLMDATGIDGLTLRKIAAELNVQAPALYWHFKNKQALIDAMATTVLLDVAEEAGLPATGDQWREHSAAYMRALRRGLLAHRDGAKVFSGTHLDDARMYDVMEAGLALMTEAGFGTADAALAMNTLYCFTVGFAVEEQAVHPRPGEADERYEPAARAERIGAEERPRMAAAGEALFGDFDARFETGLQIVLAGIDARRGQLTPGN